MPKCKACASYEYLRRLGDYGCYEMGYVTDPNIEACYKYKRK